MPRSPKEPEEFVEVDPSGRYGRYAEVLGAGAYKRVFKGFDELEGMEVAWNQVKIAEVIRKSSDLSRLYSEVDLLMTLKHKNIIKCYSSWVDTEHNNINFITEVFTSGNLREYRNKHKHVNIKALKNWSRQILEGLVYLHSHDPPVIHRDLKCDNIFVNGNQGEVKIGDLGLAAILHQANAAHSVIGTPEFMAPELYEEEYNELVDIYAFGMCLLELVTFEYPYSECANAAQIYKKVSSGIKPASLSKVNDPEVKKFIEKCIANVSNRLSAEELLDDPFLLITVDAEDRNCRIYPCIVREDGDPNTTNADTDGMSLSSGHDFTIEGQRKNAHTIFLKLRIENHSGKTHDVHFPFDIEEDTAINVASEMVSVLSLTDEDVTAIAVMIESEIKCHIPNWMPKEIAKEIHDIEAVKHNLDSQSKDQISALPTESAAGVLDLSSESNEDSFLCEPALCLGNKDNEVLEGDLSAEFHGDECTDGRMDDDTGTYTNVQETEQAHVEAVIHDLEKLLMEQNKEMEDLQKEHEKAVEKLLRQLPREIRSTALEMCRLKFSI